MHKHSFCYLVLLGVCCFSCQKNTRKAATFFDSLAVASTQLLVKQKASLRKEVYIGNKRDTIQLRPDSAYWANDLDVFKQLAVFQKPAYRDSYKMEDGLQDEQSNLTIRQFKAIKPTPISVVRFYYYHDFNQLKKIEADYQEDNALYSTTRHLIMEFDEIAGKPALSYYSMDGFQKMILSDSTLYSVHSYITY